MGISSIVDTTSNALSGAATRDPAQTPRRVQASSAASDAAVQLTQYAATTPPVQLSGDGQFRAAVATVQGVAAAVANTLSVNPTRAANDANVAANATAAVAGPAVASQSLASADVNTGVAQINVQVGTFNVSTGTFLPGVGALQTFNFNPGANSLNVLAHQINQTGAGVSAQVLQGALGFQIALTGTLGSAVSVQVKAEEANAVQAAGAATQATATTLTFKPLATLNSTADAQAAQETAKAVTAAGGPGSVAGLVQGAQALVIAINHATGVAATHPGNATAQTAATNLVAALNGAQGSTRTGQITFAQIGVAQTANGQLTVDQNRLQQAAATNPAGVASLLTQAANQVGQVAANALTAPQQASDRASVTGVGNGDNPYVAVAAADQSQAQATNNPQPTLLGYAPTTQNQHALAQYLSVSGL